MFCWKSSFLVSLIHCFMIHPRGPRINVNGDNAWLKHDRIFLCVVPSQQSPLWKKCFKTLLRFEFYSAVNLTTNFSSNKQGTLRCSFLLVTHGLPTLWQLCLQLLSPTFIYFVLVLTITAREHSARCALLKSSTERSDHHDLGFIRVV